MRDRAGEFVALGNIVGRMAAPGSERATDDWLKNRSGLDELHCHSLQRQNKEEGLEPQFEGAIRGALDVVGQREHVLGRGLVVLIS